MQKPIILKQSSMKKYLNFVKVIKSLSLVCFVLLPLNFLCNEPNSSSRTINSNDMKEITFSDEKKHKAITQEYLKDLGKQANFKVYAYETHPFKDISFEDLQKYLNLLPIFESQIKDNIPINYNSETNNKNYDKANMPTDYNIASNYSFNIDLSFKKLKFLEDSEYTLNIFVRNTNEQVKFSDFPPAFNASEKWPGCICDIHDKRDCGNTWAFAASEVLSDRLCIASLNKTNVTLSPQDLISCDTTPKQSLSDYLETTWQYLIDVGAVTEECFPLNPYYCNNEPCINICSDPNIVYKKYQASAYANFQYVNDIKKELFNYGTVETAFMVYLDFLSYQQGVYKKNSDYLVGTQFVRIVGWGIENNEEYWIVANNWGKSWGENGYFRIAIKNCCSFEENVFAGYARLI